MKAIGNRSVSSLLTILVDVAWFAIAAVLAISLVILLSGSRVGFRLDVESSRAALVSHTGSRRRGPSHAPYDPTEGRRE